MILDFFWLPNAGAVGYKISRVVRSGTKWGIRPVGARSELVTNTFSYAMSSAALDQRHAPQWGLKNEYDTRPGVGESARTNGAGTQCFEADSYTPWILRDA